MSFENDRVFSEMPHFTWLVKSSMNDSFAFYGRVNTPVNYVPSVYENLEEEVARVA